MKFVKFEIQNFKGIKAATLELMPAGANVFTLIGLNESGKTTVLEAIDDFDIEKEQTEALYGAKRASAFARFIPKHLEASFTGKTTTTATVSFEQGEIRDVIDRVAQETGVEIDPESVPSEIRITRGYRFENSDYKETIDEWELSLTGKKRRNKLARGVEEDVLEVFKDAVSGLLPKIVYFPTFLFSIPDKIILNPAPGTEKDVNRLYRQIVQDVASSLDSPLNIKTHLIDRILNEQTVAEHFLSIWNIGPDKEKQINATLNALSAHLTRTIFESWGRIFSGNLVGRELLVRLAIDQDGDRKQVYLKFVLKDGQQEYDVSERSLGFRWFFSFLLFTYYRVFAKGRGATLFLLDEPASNLHSRAQTQLLDSFARIAYGQSSIMYSTHSHYMISPEWLDQAFVVANKAIDYDHAIGAASENKPTEVDVQRYRAFVGMNPDKTTYFQPVLDKLDVAPSRLDLLKDSVLVEGKGDYYCLEYGRRVLLESASDVAVVPTRGAAGMDELIGLFLGWGVRFAICLDSDRAGLEAQRRYLSEWALEGRNVFTLADLDDALGNSRIEDLLTEEDMQLISRRLGIAVSPTKSQVQLFFGEALARREVLPLSEAFRRRVARFEELIGALFPRGMAASKEAVK